MWYINAVVGYPIKGFQPNQENGLIEISNETMNFIHSHPFWLWDGNTVVEPTVVEPTIREKTPDEIIQNLTNVLQQRLDMKAREHRYDDIKSLCTYLPDDPNPIYATEGALGRVWRSDTWTVSTTVMTAVLNGEREIPSEQELIGLLMPLKWVDEI